MVLIPPKKHRQRKTRNDIIAAAAVASLSIFAPAPQNIAHASGNIIDSVALITSYYSYSDRFAKSMVSIGDLNNDGVDDLGVGAKGDDTGGSDRGAVHILFMNADGTVDSSTKIASGTNGGPTLSDLDFFGNSVATVGDLNNDGVDDLAVGAIGDDTGGSSRGAVHILFMNTDGTVDSSTKIASSTNGGPTLVNNDSFGYSATAIGDLNNDGVDDLAVGAKGDDTGGSSRGAVHILFMNADGTVDSSTKIAHQTNGGPTLSDGDDFGYSATAIGDLNNDGVDDLAVGARGDNTGGSNFGAVHILFMNTDGTVDSSTKIAHQTNGGPTLSNNDYFTSSMASVGDLNADGVDDLAVGAYRTTTSAPLAGAVHILFMNTDGTVDSTTKIEDGFNGVIVAGNSAFFGTSIAIIDDLDGDGVDDIAVGTKYGNIHILFMEDTAAPNISLTAPTNGATVGGSSVSLTADASDNVAVAGVQFKYNTNTNIGSEDTSAPFATTWDTTAVPDGAQSIIAVARDTAGNYATSTAVTVTVNNDTDAPSISAGTPSTEQPVGTTQVTLSVTTDENATCKYGTTPDTVYDSISNTFETTGGTTHTQTITGLTNNTTYTYYVRCTDNTNANTNDYAVTFSVAQEQQSGGVSGGYSRSRTNNTPEQTRQNLINTILSLISKLQEQLNSQTNINQQETNNTFNTNLSLGTTHPDVLKLQQFLNNNGFTVALQGPGSKGNETNIFGFATQSALIQFQKANNITPAIGLFGPVTRGVVNGR
jgi:hypothetical protein